VLRREAFFAFGDFGAEHAVIIGVTGQRREIFLPLMSQPPWVGLASVPNATPPAAAAPPSEKGWE